MKKLSKVSMVLSLVIILLAVSVPVAAAGGGSAAAMNAKFTKWEKRAEVIHIVVYGDLGRPGQPAAVVPEGKPVLMGFEWADESTTVLEDNYLNDPSHDITLSIDSGPAFSVKSGYQTPFVAATRSGPAWSWDHDGDGPGDGNGNGIGDWSGAVMFFRYQVSGLSAGTHTFEFVVVNGGVPSLSDLITVEVVAGD